MTSLRPDDRSLLPLTPLERPGHRHGSRSFQTCLFRCGNQCDHPEPNPTDHGHVRDEIAKALGRRSILRGAAVVGGGALVLTGFGTTGAAAAAPATAAAPGRARGRDGSFARADFDPVAPNTADDVVLADGFDHHVIIRWGDPLVVGAPAFDPHAQTPAAAARQFGFNCDYVGVLPLSRDRALMVVNHEYTNPVMMFPTGEYSETEKIEIEMANHGMSVVRIRRGATDGLWVQDMDLTGARENRRIHVGSEFALAGPVAGDERVRTTADPTGMIVLGTLNNCAGGTTPWGTVLSGEENFHQYFGSSGGLDPRYADAYARYGIRGGDARGWQEVDPRFDLTVEPHEVHRFGWIVEIDPYDPAATPVKHTMLGRFKHEGANVTVDRGGHVVAYMGDDERGDYLYKFVSRDTIRRGPSRRARRANMQLLDRGTLYVARLTGDGTADGEYDGTGEWLALTSDTESFVEGMSVNDVLLFTRLAADRVAPTRMDRPEDVEPNPRNGKVYAALTNNSRRGSTWEVDEANPLDSSHVRANPVAPLVETAGNRNGYVLEMAPDRNDHTGLTFTWNLMLVCGDPAAQETYFAGYDKSQVSPISCPDNVAFDTAGNLWIATDGNALGGNDGLFRVPVDGADRGRVEQLLTVPKGAECCGPLVHDRDRSVFFAPQHPGDGSPSFESPNSTWPHTDPFPRPSVCVAYRA